LKPSKIQRFCKTFFLGGGATFLIVMQHFSYCDTKTSFM